MRGYRGSTVGGGNVVKPPRTLRLEDTKTQGFSSYSNTYYFSYLFGNKELLARQVGPPYCGIGATIRIGQEIRSLPYAGREGLDTGLIRRAQRAHKRARSQSWWWRGGPGGYSALHARPWTLWDESLMVSAATQVSLLRKHGSHSSPQLFSFSLV